MPPLAHYVSDPIFPAGVQSAEECQILNEECQILNYSDTNNVKDSHHTFDFPVLQLTINKKVRGTFSINYGYTNKTAGLPALFYEGEIKEGRAILTGIYEKADLVRRDIFIADALQY